MRFIQYLIIGKNQVFGKLLTNQKIAHKIVKPYVYKALREGLKTHDNGKIQNLRGFDSLSLRAIGNGPYFPSSQSMATKSLTLL